jgi:CubicO group peptidase (beta-lactamase class C family)
VWLAPTALAVASPVVAHELMESTRRHLSRVALEAQRRSRTPALVAGVAHRGALIWDTAVGSADLSDPSVPLGPDTQFLVASNTKTFTAAMIMQLRDEGRLRLEDTVDAQLPDSTHPLTIGQLLSHTSGMQREPVGNMWDTLEGPDPADTVENWNAAEPVLAPRRLWHYSNLAYMVLGEIVARLDGRAWEESLRVRLLDPIELTRTSTTLAPPHAGLYFVPEFSDVPITEPLVFTGSTLPAGGLASTVSDLARWHGFLLDPDPAILSADTVEEMCQPQITADPNWERAYGLGIFLRRRGTQIWFGHTGGAPGGITAAFSHAGSGVTAIVLTNQSAAKDPGATAVDLGAHVVDHDLPLETPWVPGSEVPEELRGVLGLWFSEGSPAFFSVRQGQLEVRGRGDADSAPAVVFTRESEDLYRTASGSERGERLVIRRRPDGTVWQLNWATYRWTREPLGFGEPNPGRPLTGD